MRSAGKSCEAFAEERLAKQRVADRGNVQAVVDQRMPAKHARVVVVPLQLAPKVGRHALHRAMLAEYRVIRNA